MSSTHEVQLAIYDLSQGMARTLSAQFLGPQHAIDILPHTAIVVYGKEYFFGRGIEWCPPNVFRSTRNIHPIEIQSLGHTSCSCQEFEEWCRMQGCVNEGGNGRFGVESYDLLYRNCNTFANEAAREGLRLGKGVPQWILEVPEKFLRSPMGMMVRPILEGMQITNSAPTNVGGTGVSANAGNFNFGGSGHGHANASTAASDSPVSSTAIDSNPWANIPSATSNNTPKLQMPLPTSNEIAHATTGNTASSTPLLDKQSGPLLSTNTDIVPACVAKLSKENITQHQSDLLAKLADSKASWTDSELCSVYDTLRTFLENKSLVSYSLMLLRLAVLRKPQQFNEKINQEESKSTQYVAQSLLEDQFTPANQSLAWCVLSNAIGSTPPHPPLSWLGSSERNDSELFLQIIDRAMNDCHPTTHTNRSNQASKLSLKQSASAFLYNSSRYLAQTNSTGEESQIDKRKGEETVELSDGIMAILIGCLENIQEEEDPITLTRKYLCIGRIFKSEKQGRAAVSLVRDLGLLEGVSGVSGNGEVNELAKEVIDILALQ